MGVNRNIKIFVHYLFNFYKKVILNDFNLNITGENTV